MRFREMMLVLVAISSMLVISCQDKDYFISNQYPNEYQTFYEDLRFPASQVRVQGSSNLPEFKLFRNNTLALTFSGSTMNQAFIIAQLPHARIPNSTLYSHFHWSYPTPKVTGSVVWCVEYTCADINDIFPYTNISCVVDYAEFDYQHHMTKSIPLENTLTRSAICDIRIFRDVASINDTMGDIFLLEYDIHYSSHFYGDAGIGINST